MVLAGNLPVFLQKLNRAFLALLNLSPKGVGGLTAVSPKSPLRARASVEPEEQRRHLLRARSPAQAATQRGDLGIQASAADVSVCSEEDQAKSGHK